MHRRLLIKIQIYLLLFAAWQGRCQGTDFDEDDDMEMRGIKMTDVSKRQQLLKVKYRALLKRIGLVPVIRLKPTDDIHNLIGDPPRNFSVVVLVISSSQYKGFRQLTNDLGSIAKSYMDHNRKAVTTFFLEVCYEDHPEIFRIVGDKVREIPALYHLPDRGRFARYANTGRSLEALKPSHIKNWVEYETGANIPGITDNSIDSFAKAITVLMLLRAIYQNRNVLQKLDPRYTSAFAAVVFVIGISSGYMYVNIANPPIIVTDTAGYWRLIRLGGRQQTIAELFIIFALIGSNAFGMILMSEFGPSTGNNSGFVFLGLFLFSTTISILKWLSLLKSGSSNPSFLLGEV